MRPAMILASLIAMATPALAVAPEPTSVAESAGMRTLLDMFLDEGNWVRLGSTLSDRSLDDAISSTPELKNLLDQYPGLRPRLTTTLRARTSYFVRRHLQSMRPEFKRALAEGMSSSQISALAGFFSLPGGKEMFALAVRSSPEDADFTESPEFEKIAAKMAADPKSAEAILAAQKTGAIDKLDYVLSKLDDDASGRWEDLGNSHLSELRALAANTTAAYIAEQEAKAQLR